MAKYNELDSSWNEEEIDKYIKAIAQGPSYSKLPASGLLASERQAGFTEAI